MIRLIFYFKTFEDIILFFLTSYTSDIISQKTIQRMETVNIISHVIPENIFNEI